MEDHLSMLIIPTHISTNKLPSPHNFNNKFIKLPNQFTITIPHSPSTHSHLQACMHAWWLPPISLPWKILRRLRGGRFHRRPYHLSTTTTTTTTTGRELSRRPRRSVPSAPCSTPSPSSPPTVNSRPSPPACPRAAGI